MCRPCVVDVKREIRPHATRNQVVDRIGAGTSAQMAGIPVRAQHLGTETPDRVAVVALRTGEAHARKVAPLVISRKRVVHSRRVVRPSIAIEPAVTVFHCGRWRSLLLRKAVERETVGMTL